MAVSLAGSRVSTQADRTARYMLAMERFARFVREGNKDPLAGRGAAAPDGWVIKDGGNTGAIGCGYYGKHLSTLPCKYMQAPPHLAFDRRSRKNMCATDVIATSTTGGAFFAELANLTKSADERSALLSEAEAAMQWTAGVVLPTGEIPYILDGKTDTKTWPLDTIAYATEGVVGVDTYAPHARPTLSKGFESTVRYLLATQGTDGAWGTLRSPDQQRSPRVLTLLSWWLHSEARAGRADAKVSAAIEKYLAFLWKDAQNPAPTDYGVGGFSPKVLLHTTSFVGLAVAETLAYQVTF